MQIRKIVSNKFELPSFFQAKTAQRYKNLKNGTMTNVCAITSMAKSIFLDFFQSAGPFGTAPLKKNSKNVVAKF